MSLCLYVFMSLYLYVSMSLCPPLSKNSDSVITNQNFVRKRGGGGGGGVDFQLCLSLVGNSPDVVRQSRSYRLTYLLYLHTAIIVQRYEGEKYEAVSDTM